MARWRPDLKERDATPEALYLRRREFLALGAAGAVGVLLPAGAGGGEPVGPALPVARKLEKAGGENPNRWDEVTTYNNFYELGTEKADPARNAGSLRTRPWTVEIDGEVKRPQTVAIDELLRWFPLEERIYRMRCVEAWSMVIPWVGFPLADLARRVEPTSRAKYVAFQTLLDPAQLPGQRRPSSTGRTSRGCGSTRRPIRSRSSPSGSTAERCRARTARRSGWWCRGSTGSRGRSRS